jgi:hypothetical protein
VALAEQFLALKRELPPDWETARLRLIIPDDGDCARAAALLGPLNPGRRGKLIHFLSGRHGIGFGPDRIRSLLRRLDDEGIDGAVELLGVETGTAASPASAQTLVSKWDELVAALPPDWSDAFVEVELPSTDYIEPGALRLSPVNPTRTGSRPVFRFRVARRFGYGASPEMARRCLERLDEAGITGDVRLLNVLSDTKPVQTQGPVIYSGGRPT